MFALIVIYQHHGMYRCRPPCFHHRWHFIVSSRRPRRLIMIGISLYQVVVSVPMVINGVVFCIRSSSSLSLAFADIHYFFGQPRLYRLYLFARCIFHPVLAPAMADGMPSTITQEMLRDRVVKARILSCFLFVQFG